MARTRTQSKSTPETKAPAKPRTAAKAKADTKADTKAKTNGNGAATTAKPRRTSKPKAAPIGHEQIAAKAYEIWESKGRPLGTDEQNWQEAEAALAPR
ncbi:DUF2934 domain-containing protein [Phycisphaerales bacterium AB-hyl4]|uniref:DUF2934 domain-containing protein n=1 Tax=Natronomicrosphaera hydrolytica TaxID=3242702 RepID=A0ABV4U218_9BACT